MIGIATECVKCGKMMRSCTIPAYCTDCDPIYVKIRARYVEVAAEDREAREDAMPKVSDEEALALEERIRASAEIGFKEADGIVAAVNAKMTSANGYMVGGDHYRDRPGEQHWDRQWRLFGPGYFVGCATKYLERYEKKGGLDDLRKAIHFTQKLLELETAYAKGEGPAPGNGRAPLSCKERE